MLSTRNPSRWAHVQNLALDCANSVSWKHHSALIAGLECWLSSLRKDTKQFALKTALEVCKQLEICETSRTEWQMMSLQSFSMKCPMVHTWDRSSICLTVPCWQLRTWQTFRCRWLYSSRVKIFKIRGWDHRLWWPFNSKQTPQKPPHQREGGGRRARNYVSHSMTRPSSSIFSVRRIANKLAPSESELRPESGLRTECKYSEYLLAGQVFVPRSSGQRGISCIHCTCSTVLPLLVGIWVLDIWYWLKCICDFRRIVTVCSSHQMFEKRRLMVW